MAPPKGPLANTPRDLRDDFVGVPPEELPDGPPMRWPPKPKKITKDTFHAKVQGRTSEHRADRAPHYRKGGWVKAAKGGSVKRQGGGNVEPDIKPALPRQLPPGVTTKIPQPPTMKNMP